MESVLEIPASVGHFVRVPDREEMPPGPLATTRLDIELLRLGLATAEQLAGSESADEDPRRRAFYEEKAAHANAGGKSCQLLFDYDFPGVHDIRTYSVWAAGELLEYGGDFNKYVTSKRLQKQEGIVFRHLLRMILLIREFQFLTPPAADPTSGMPTSTISHRGHRLLPRGRPGQHRQSPRTGRCGQRRVTQAEKAWWKDRRMSEVNRLLETLRRIEALHFRTDVAGERDASAEALEAIRRRLAELEQSDPPVEYRFSLPDSWSRRLLMALLRRYGIDPYRYRGQRHTTVMARVSRSFVDNTLWPEFCELNEVLRNYLSEVTGRVIREAIHADSSEATERSGRLAWSRTRNTFCSAACRCGTAWNRTWSPISKTLHDSQQCSSSDKRICCAARTADVEDRIVHVEPIPNRAQCHTTAFFKVCEWPENVSLGIPSHCLTCRVIVHSPALNRG